MYTEYILRVQEPTSNLSATDEVEKVFNDLTDGLEWSVFLTRRGPELQVTLHADIFLCSVKTESPIWLHIISFSGSQLLSIKMIDESGYCLPHRFTAVVSILANEVEHDNEYRFCILVSTLEDTSQFYPCQKVKSTHLIEEKVEPKPSSLQDDIMMTLLKDIYSVETRFLFTADPSFADIGLWAHRSILSKHQVFRDLIAQETAARSSSVEGGSEFSPLTLTVDKVSLATFCAVLMFLYSGKIEQEVDPSNFAISKPHTSLMVHDTPGRVKDKFRWHPLDSDSAWNVNPVTWSDLLIAADIYKIEALHARCQAKVIESIDESNVVETLFRVGSHSLGVKTAAVEFMAKNMGAMMADGKDPFLGFAGEKNCHEIMVEVMRSGVRNL